MVSRFAAIVRLQKQGFDVHRHLHILRDLIPEKGVSSAALQRIERVAKMIGAKTIVLFYLHYEKLFAFRQMKRESRIQNKELKTTSFISLMESFSKPIQRMLSAPSLERKGYYIELEHSLDNPFVFVFSLRGIKRENEIARINFNLFFSKDHSPGIMIANMQGRRKSAIDEFKSKFGRSPFDYLVGRMRKSFTARHAVAVNPKFFNYYTHLNPRLVAEGMYDHGTMTPKEYDAYFKMSELILRDFAPLESNLTPEMLAARNKVEEGMKRIKTEGIGMHSAAFKHAGFKRSKRKYWKHQRN